MTAPDPLVERQKVTVEVLRQLITQVLALSATLIAAAVGFAKLSPPGPAGTCYFLGILITLGASVVFGLLALGAVISTLVNNSLDVGSSRILQTLIALELIAFGLALVLAVLLALNFLGVTPVLPHRSSGPGWLSTL